MWIYSFLANRQQRVFHNGKLSNWKEVVSGVPQGSLLGPVLFALLIDSLQPIHAQSSYIKYADDISIVHNVRHKDEDQLQQEWLHICNWSIVNELPINFKKTNVLDVVTKKGLTLHPLRGPDNSPIKTITKTKLLGVVLSADMKWDDHVEYTVSKAAKTIFVLTTLKHLGVDHRLLWTTYFALTRSILTYAFPVFCNLPARLHKRLQKIENRAKRIIEGEPQVKLAAFCEEQCRRLADQIRKHPSHPLRLLFDARKPQGRSSKSFEAPFARTSRFKNSFIRFA
jgi:hypothetical protein